MAQLRWGFDGSWQRFNRSNISARRRHGASDCRAEDMPACEAAYWAVREELLERFSDPWNCWAYRRFELGVEPLNADTGAWPTVPPKPTNIGAPQ
jgi:hypothetical protein